jgi:ferritin-like metal-binding protein YciE
MALHTLHDLYVEHIQDLYSAEQQILTALPKMIEKASHRELRDGFSQHLHQTQEHARRLEGIAQRLGVKAGGKTCKGMEGLLKEGEEMMKEDADPDVLDAALISAAQRVEHYEIAGYGCARTYANALNKSEDAKVLQDTLDEEAETDKKLTRLAEGFVNADAKREGFADRGTSATPRRNQPSRADREVRP